MFALGGLTYRLRHCETGKEYRTGVHYNRLKQYDDTRADLQAKNAQTQSPEMDVTQSQQSTSDWYTIKRVTGRKKVKDKEFFQVQWEDNTKEWLPTEDVTEYAKNQFFVNQKQKKRRKRRRQ